MSISEIYLNQSGPPAERQLALIDFNKDLYVASVKESKIKFHKLGRWMLKKTYIFIVSPIALQNHL